MTDKLNFGKMNGLIPAIVIDNKNEQLLMLGFMNKEALQKTLETNLVTFFSRTRNELWVKGRTSKNYLHVVEISSDCDHDTILIRATPDGNVCHTGAYSCFEGIKNISTKNFVLQLYDLIKDRKKNRPENSYTTKLFNEGENRIIQKFGEEAVETIIAAKNGNRKEIIDETSDLIYHMLVMLAEKEIELDDVINNLKKRHK
jgi:phosphoribosyl-ATP pyrophosphohydrolase/phosphoribosyl-AMP cyclohydrolase